MRTQWVELVVGGWDMVVVLAKLATAVWLVRNIMARVHRARSMGVYKSLFSILVEKEAFRINVGFIVACIGVALWRVMDIPLRAIRFAWLAETPVIPVPDNPVSDYIQYAPYWATAGSVLVVIGMAMIMWSSFCKLGLTRRGAAIIVVTLGVLAFVLGVALTLGLSIILV